jgi:hypothetical protein
MEQRTYGYNRGDESEREREDDEDRAERELDRNELDRDSEEDAADDEERARADALADRDAGDEASAETADERAEERVAAERMDTDEAEAERMDTAAAERMDTDEAEAERMDTRGGFADRPAAEAAADEQLTVPEDREAAAMADGRVTGMPATDPEREFELFPSTDVDGFRQRWDALQASFVDDPKGAASQAEALIGELVDRVGRRHQELRDEIGRNGDSGDATESNRIAIRRYRAFFRSLVGA